jgi:hypothetical protein
MIQITKISGERGAVIPVVRVIIPLRLQKIMTNRKLKIGYTTL